MVYGAECWAVKKKERKLHTTEMRMLRWARGKTRLDHVRNVDIWKEAHVYPKAEFLGEKRLRWFGHVQRRDKDDATRKILQMTVDGKRNRGRPKLRWRDLVKEDMARNQMMTEMGEDRKHWHVMMYGCSENNSLELMFVICSENRCNGSCTISSMYIDKRYTLTHTNTPITRTLILGNVLLIQLKTTCVQQLYY